MSSMLEKIEDIIMCADDIIGYRKEFASYSSQAREIIRSCKLLMMLYNDCGCTGVKDECGLSALEENIGKLNDLIDFKDI